VRNPVSLRRLVYIDGHKAVIYRALKPNPGSGQTPSRFIRWLTGA
jgi:hypothetical protein